MTIEKGRPWGVPGPLPPGGRVVRSDAEARTVVEEARREGRAPPVLGLAGGDLCRTLGGAGADRLEGDGAVHFPLDLGEVLVDGRLHVFLAHLVARSALWGRGVVVMNAQWLGGWNLGPRAHPNDGRLDSYQWRLGPSARLAVRRRLPAGAHLPHPGVTERRGATARFDLGRRRPVRLDGEVADTGRHLEVRVVADAVTVVV